MPDAHKATSTLRRLMKNEPTFSLLPPSTTMRGVRRRDFVKMAIATGVGLSVAPGARAVESREGIAYRKLGRTGESVSMVGLGGAHIGQQQDPQESISI